MVEITVALGERSYPVTIGEGAFDLLPETLTKLGAKGAVAVCTDANVGRLCGERAARLIASAGLRPIVCAMPAGEEHKGLGRIEEFCGRFIEAGLDRDSLVVALGGGVVGDVAGFAAATYMRGIRYVQVPTTVVAQVDSSVGGKTAVNHRLAKNVLGAFHQPSAVLIDLALLSTLPDRELRAGLAEVVKHGMIADAALFEYMEAHAGPLLRKELDAFGMPVRRSCEIKASVVATDEREQGIRAILNYGHTFGHGIETVTEYKTFLHGEAVALGMQAAAVLAHDLRMASADVVERQRACLDACGLPVSWPEIPVEETLDAMRRDKKARGGAMRFILPDRIGHVVQRTDIPLESARKALVSLKRM